MVAPDSAALLPPPPIPPLTPGQLLTLTLTHAVLTLTPLAPTRTARPVWPRRRRSGTSSGPGRATIAAPVAAEGRTSGEEVPGASRARFCVF